MAAKWAGGAVAVVAVIVLAGQCGRDDAAAPVSDAASTQVAPTTAPAAIQPALAAPVTTAPATTRPAPTTTSAPPAPQPAPRPQPRPQPAVGEDGGAEKEDSDKKDSDSKAGGGAVSYKNCAAARDAGAAPVRRGEPGYARHLDRDGDGVGCE